MDADRPASGYALASERVALWLLVAIIAWMQFPLGSNHAWSWSLLVILIAVDWLVWMPSGLADIGSTARIAKRVAWPAALMILVLVWIWLQSTSFTPLAWHNSAWRLVDGVAAHPVAGAISINPYVTQTEWMKLASYVAVGWVAAVLSIRHENARVLFIAVFAVAVAYAVYGIALSAFGTSQITIFENVPLPYGRAVSGGLVAKNSFATFTGMALLAGLTLLADAGRHRVVAARGWRTHLRTLMQFALGSGAVWLVGSLILLGALIASQSRAGLIATLVGLGAMFALVLANSARRGNLRWTLAGGGAALVCIVALVLVSGQSLQSRFENLIETGGRDELRPIMWDVAIRALDDHPYTGTGLGTYPDNFHLYAKTFVPYVVDRAHNDYLEFAMGVGLPAAILWLIAMTILVVQCARGVLNRHRRRNYALTAVGASALVAFHSLFDFSLQMPAVAVLYAVILGIGIGQSQSTRDSGLS